MQGPDLAGMQWHIFVAHADAESERARALTDQLRKVRPELRVFLDKEMPPGCDWDTGIGNAFVNSRVHAILLAREWDKAYYLREEIARAIELARRGAGSAVVPVFLDGKPPRLQDYPYGLALKASISGGGIAEIADQLIARLDGLGVPAAAGPVAWAPPSSAVQRREMLSRLEKLTPPQMELLIARLDLPVPQVPARTVSQAERAVAFIYLVEAEKRLDALSVAIDEVRLAAADQGHGTLLANLARLPPSRMIQLRSELGVPSEHVRANVSPIEHASDIIAFLRAQDRLGKLEEWLQRHRRERVPATPLPPRQLDRDEAAHLRQALAEALPVATLAAEAKSLAPLCASGDPVSAANRAGAVEQLLVCARVLRPAHASLRAFAERFFARTPLQLRRAQTTQLPNQLTSDARLQLVEALRRCDAVGRARYLLLANLPTWAVDGLSAPLLLEELKLDERAARLIDVCSAQPGGLDLLAAAMLFVDGDDAAEARRFDVAVTTVLHKEFSERELLDLVDAAVSVGATHQDWMRCFVTSRASESLVADVLGDEEGTDDLARLIHQLVQRSRGELRDFLWRLSRLPNARSNQLVDWVARLSVQEPPPPLRAPPPAPDLLMISVAAVKGGHALKGWLWASASAPAPLPAKETVFTDWTQVAAEIGRLRQIVVAERTDERAPRVELILPRELIGANFAFFPLPTGRRQVYLGVRHELVVRPYERVYANDAEMRRQHAAKCKRCHDGSVCPADRCDEAEVRWLGALLQRAHDDYELLCLPKYLGVGLTEPPGAGTDNSDTLLACIDAGVPFVVWVRDATALDARVALAEAFKPDRLARLPQFAMSARQAALESGSEHVLGRQLVVLWDPCTSKRPPDADSPRHPIAERG